MKLTWDALREQGLDPEYPKSVDIWIPKTSEEVDQFGKQLSDDIASGDGPPEDDVRGMVMSMLSESIHTVLFD